MTSGAKAHIGSALYGPTKEAAEKCISSGTFRRASDVLTRKYAGSRSEAGFDVQLRDDGAPDTCRSYGRKIRALVDSALHRMDAEMEAMYASTGRPSIAPERLLRAQLLMVLYSIRSERQLMEQLDYNLLFRWFVGLEMDDAVWDVTVFTKNRERLIAGQASQQLLAAVVEEARGHDLLSEEHFTVDATLIQAWASAQSFKDKKNPPPRDPARARMGSYCCATRWNRPPMRMLGCIRRHCRTRQCRATRAMR